MQRHPKCYACGKWMPHQATTCPHCDTPRDELKEFFAFLRPSKINTVSGGVTGAHEEIELAGPLLAVMVVLLGLAVVVAVRDGAGVMAALMGAANNTTAALGAMVRFEGHDTVASGQLWRFVTANFLHFGAMHLIFNGMGLADLVPLRQHVYGAGLTLAVFLFTGVAGFVAAYALAPANGVITAGASASLFGLVGVGLGDAKRTGDYGRMRRDLTWVVGCTLFGLFIPISHTAHFGGLAAGVVFGLALPEHRARHWAPLKTVGNVAGAVSVLVVLGSFVLAARAYGAH